MGSGKKKSRLGKIQGERRQKKTAVEHHDKCTHENPKRTSPNPFLPVTSPIPTPTSFPPFPTTHDVSSQSAKPIPAYLRSSHQANQANNRGGCTPPFQEEARPCMPRTQMPPHMGNLTPQIQILDFQKPLSGPFWSACSPVGDPFCWACSSSGSNAGTGWMGRLWKDGT